MQYGGRRVFKPLSSCCPAIAFRTQSLIRCVHSVCISNTGIALSILYCKLNMAHVTSHDHAQLSMRNQHWQCYYVMHRHDV